MVLSTSVNVNLVLLSSPMHALISDYFKILASRRPSYVALTDVALISEVLKTFLPVFSVTFFFLFHSLVWPRVCCAAEYQNKELQLSVRN